MVIVLIRTKEERVLKSVAKELLRLLKVFLQKEQHTYSTLIESQGWYWTQCCAEIETIRGVKTNITFELLPMLYKTPSANPYPNNAALSTAGKSYAYLRIFLNGAVTFKEMLKVLRNRKSYLRMFKEVYYLLVHEITHLREKPYKMPPGTLVKIDGSPSERNMVKYFNNRHELRAYGNQIAQRLKVDYKAKLKALFSNGNLGASLTTLITDTWEWKCYEKYWSEKSKSKLLKQITDSLVQWKLLKVV